MNNERRKYLKHAIALLADALEEIDYVRNEEEAAFDSMPEGLQLSERGELIEQNVDTLNDKFSELEDIIQELEELL